MDESFLHRACVNSTFQIEHNINKRLSRLNINTKIISCLSPLNERSKSTKPRGKFYELDLKTEKKPPNVSEMLKKFEIGRKSLKNNPARFLVPLFFEKKTDFILPSIKSDLKLLRDFNSKSDLEYFKMRKNTIRPGIGCRRVFDTDFRVKRVHFEELI